MPADKRNIPKQLPLVFEAEIWKPIVGYEGLYEVSDLGRVRRVADVPGWRGGIRLKAPYLLKLHLSEKGYLRTRLFKNGKSSTVRIARIVIEAFNGPRPPGKEINHKSADKRDNRSDNLEWLTHLDNVKHATRLGLMDARRLPRGEQHARAKLTAADVREIRQLGGRIGQRRIAARFGVDKSTVQAVLRRETWKHVV